MKKITTDICVIGAGSGGLNIAAGAAQMGAQVVLFEAERMGGDCLNSGCVPSKALLAAAKAAHNAAGNPDMGIYGGEARVDFAAVKAHVADVIAEIAPHDSVARFTELGVTVIEERAAFTAPRIVQSENYEVRAKFFVIATGSKPVLPPIPGLDGVPVHTNESIFADLEKPDHLVIIGGGPIGVEMAQAHRRLGCKVTIVEAFSILGRDDPEVAGFLKSRLRDEGVEMIEGVGVARVGAGKAGAGVIEVKLTDDRILHASHLLVAAGRQPVIENLGLEAAGIRMRSNGIITDQRLRTNDKRVFAIGDVTGRAQFTHIAGYHAGIVLRNMLFRLPAKVDDSLTPWVTFTDPELAHVGLGEAAAGDMWGAKNIRVKKVPLTLNDRAVAERRTEGMVKIIAHQNGRIIGATIMAPNAGEMILTWALAISGKAKIAKLASMIAPYPTYGDASKRAAGAFFTDKLFSRNVQRLVKLLLRL
jgi:pyruvate/2-oxoglutarate dehydrogenase complex dihydrolipoamide dehydrogenase (E3) component